MVDLMLLLTDYGYISLFVTSFLASTILPLGSEGLLVLMVLGNFNVHSVVLVASIANFLGACTSYYIGLKGRTLLISKYMKISDKQLKRAEAYFGKYGAISLFFTWLPGIGDAIAVAGGVLHYSFSQFVIFVFLGKLFRYAAVAYFAIQI
ncbi:DedA family protein [Methanolobus zinderi]|uniref:DedA family protein n=1 Tax=Methanolobus zinderi TaxID=536044 RepID=A0A7D5EEN6_9EURY|nr:YqaA family protein [Methanolobus zinderi]QLC50116.1 DedA family protein [Methanolobus zinderi]